MAKCTEGGTAVSSMLGVLIFSVLMAAAWAQDDIREPPTIQEPAAPDEKFVRVGATVDLTCRATGKPSPSYQWYWNGVQVTSSTNPDISFDGVKGTLVIKNLSTAKEGFFNCHARSTFPNGITAVAISPKIEVRVGRVEPWNVETEVDLLTAKEGAYKYILCDDNLPKYYGPTLFKWYTVTADEFATQTELILDDRQFIDSEGSLHFTYLIEEDDLDSKYYACALSNAVEGNIRVGRRRKLTITTVPSIKERPPTLEFSNTPVTAQRQSEAQLECFFSGYSATGGKPSPTPNITWFNDKEKITTSGRYELSQHGRILKIKDLLESDEKHYNCEGGSAVSTATGTVFLNVTSAPIWVKRLASKTVIQGDDAVFDCDSRSASGENDPDPPKWYKNGNLLDETSDPNKYKFQLEKRQMTVKAAQKSSDIACFQCYVGNSEGEVFSDGCLNVILPIVITKEPETTQIVSKGDIVDLTVEATWDPLVPVTYKWIFDDTTYDHPDLPPFVVYDIDTRRTFINTSGFDDSEMKSIAGLYRHEISHRFQTEFVEVDVKLKPPPVVPGPKAAGFDYWIIGLIIGILLIIIVLIIICCVICRRKMLEGDYAVDRKETAAGLDPEKELKDSGFHDLSRADYDYLPEKKSPNLDFDDENIPLGDDESFGSNEYGDEATAFNEDGSFIGVYSKGKKAGGPPGYQPAESNV